MADLKAVGVSLNSKGELPLINAPYKIRDLAFKSQSDHVFKHELTR